MTYRAATKFFSWRLPAVFFRNVLLHPVVLRAAYAKTRNAKEKFDTNDRQEFMRRMDFEIYLWHANDVRTHMATSAEFLHLDNCQKQVALPVHHVSVKADRYFDNHIVEQHFRVIFSDFKAYKSRMGSHAPSVIADAKEAAPLLPKGLRKLLDKA
jgi:homoserine acetyltransferase